MFEERHAQIILGMHDTPLQRWEIIKEWSNWNQVGLKANANELKKFLNLDPKTELRDFQRPDDMMIYAAGATNAIKLVRDAAYARGKNLLTVAMLICWDKYKEEVTEVCVAGNLHTSDFRDPVSTSYGSGNYPSSSSDTQKSEEKTILWMLDRVCSMEWHSLKKIGYYLL